MEMLNLEVFEKMVYSCNWKKTNEKDLFAEYVREEEYGIKHKIVVWKETNDCWVYLIDGNYERRTDFTLKPDCLGEYYDDYWKITEELARMEVDSFSFKGYGDELYV